MTRVAVAVATLAFALSLSTFPAGAQTCPRGWKIAAGACDSSVPAVTRTEVELASLGEAGVGD